MTDIVVLADAAYEIAPPIPTDADPFCQVAWIFERRGARVRSDSGKENYRNASKHFIDYLQNTVGRLPYVLKEQWNILSLVLFKNWLFAHDSLGSHSRVGVLSAVRQTMLEAVSLGQTATPEIANATASEGYRETTMRDVYSKTELAAILEAVQLEERVTNAVLAGYKPTGVGRDPQERVKGINPRHRAAHGIGWNCEDNMRWYFENKMHCVPHSTVGEAGELHKRFFTATTNYHGGFPALYRKFGVSARRDELLLGPLLIRLSYLTGLNPYSLVNLKVDCLTEHPLTNTPCLSYMKLRSGGEKQLLIDLLNDKQTIDQDGAEAAELNLKREQAILVERAIKKILELTAPLRARADTSEELKSLLFIYESSGVKTISKVFHLDVVKANKWCRNLAKAYKLKTASGATLSFNLARFRPTKLTEMAAQGKDFFEIQHVAGHKSIATTLDYIEERTLDTVAEEAISTALTTIWTNRQEFNAPSTTSLPKKTIPIAPFKGLVSDCKNVFDPPRSVRLSAEYVEGAACTRYNMCLLCKNILLMQEHLPTLAHYRSQLRSAIEGNSSLDLPHIHVYERSLAVLDQIFDPDTSDFSEEELSEAIALSITLDIVVDPLIYTGVQE